MTELVVEHPLALPGSANKLILSLDVDSIPTGLEEAKLEAGGE